MATSTKTLTLVSQDVCTKCKQQDCDVICACGDQFHFECLQSHIEYIRTEINCISNVTSKNLTQLNTLQQEDNEKKEDAQANIENWRRKQIKLINEAADQAANKVQQRKEVFSNMQTIRETFDQISCGKNRGDHNKLNCLRQLNGKIKSTLDGLDSFPNINQNDIELETILASNIRESLPDMNPSSSLLNTDSLQTRTVQIEQYSLLQSNPNGLDDSEVSRLTSYTNGTSSSTNENQLPATMINAELIQVISPVPESNYGTPPPEFSNEILEPEASSTGMTTLPKCSNELSREIDSHSKPQKTCTDTEDFEPGLTMRIVTHNPPIVLSVPNDNFAGTNCCYENQLLFTEYDRIRERSHLTCISDVNDLTARRTINWKAPDVVCGSGDNEWIQDITYSKELKGYLIINRSRIRLLEDNATDLIEFHSFKERTLKRISATDAFIYLVVIDSSVSYNGDGIVLMNFAKNELVHKTFRSIMPNRVNRGAGPLAGEISDLAVKPDEQVLLSYRLERRQEVGICIFNVQNNGEDWHCIKHLVFTDCWHHDTSYTPRVDWCAKLNAFILIEHISGHVLMFDNVGEVKGESRLMNVNNQSETPINISISTNNWLCIRFESAINIFKIIEQ